MSLFEKLISKFGAKLTKKQSNQIKNLEKVSEKKKFSKFKKEIILNFSF